VQTWVDVIDVSGPLVTFRGTYADLVAHGYTLREVRSAPDRPGRELLFCAQLTQ